MMRVIGKANSKDKESEAYINTLKASATDHIEKMKLSMFSSKYIIDLNINFLLDVVKYFMDRLPCKVSFILFINLKLAFRLIYPIIFIKFTEFRD